MTLYEQYTERLRKIADINGAIALLHWDSEVNAPKKGADFRGQQLATLSALSHELSTTAELGALLQQLMEQKAELSETEACNVQRSWEDYQLATRLPVSFVRELSQARSTAFQAWIQARRENNFAPFQEPLTALIALKRQEAELLGYEGHPYNALLDQYEKGATVAQLDPLFRDVREQLVAFARELRERGTPSPSDFLRVSYDKDAQWELGLELLREMGYDFDAGRQDLSEHPFTTTFSPGDVRVTTRVHEHEPMSMIGSCIHEGGHALYEQGLPAAQYGLPLGAATSLGIHESQSRLWENNVGLSLVYWRANYDRLRRYFPTQLEGVSVEQFYHAINQVQPNFIRIEADELHYHLHILVRYELEKALMDKSLEVKDLAQAWRDKYREFLGVEVPDDLRGVLQDVHWSEGLIGYFPTYSLGSFYAAQFFAQAQKDLPQLSADIEAGNTRPLLDWLRERIHRYGRQYTSEELCERATGEPLRLSYFMDYVRRKYSAIYGI